MIELVLATDMGEHMAIVSRYMCVSMYVCVCVRGGLARYGRLCLTSADTFGEVRSKVSEEQ